MRLLILSLLALGAHTHSINYRNNLLSYAPARGEFPVQGDLAQGYLRYLDNTGAERLVGFNYPEPLYGIRSNQLRLSSNKVETQQQHLALFRAWCEQRYNALKIELEHLRAQGKQPSPHILAQFEPLEQILKTNTFQQVPGLSPEVQQVHDEHLRLWNESRLQVLQAELAQGGQPLSLEQRVSDEPIQLKTNLVQPQVQPLTAKLPQAEAEIKPTVSNVAPQVYAGFESPKPVQETEEVMKARQEHLRRYNEALQAQLKSPAQAPIGDINLQTQQTPQPVEETPEVKRAREEHLKQYNEEILRQSSVAQPQPLAVLPKATVGPDNVSFAPLPVAIKKTEPIAPLPEVTVKSSIPISIPVPLNQNNHKQKLLLFDLSKIKSEEQIADILDRIRLEEREHEQELLREKERRREEQKQAEMERQKELFQLLQDRKLVEAERISLQLQDQQRIEGERQQESKRIQSEQPIVLPSVDSTPSQPSNNYKLIAPTPVKPQAQVEPQPQAQSQPQAQAISQQQQVQNGFFLRIQAGQTTAEPIAEGVAQNPFLMRYLQQPQQLQQAELKIGKLEEPSITSSPIASSDSVSTGLSELEKANREHFKAHEMALEQLRLANLKNPGAIPTPCQH